MIMGTSVVLLAFGSSDETLASHHYREAVLARQEVKWKIESGHAGIRRVMDREAGTEPEAPGGKPMTEGERHDQGKWKKT